MADALFRVIGIYWHVILPVIVFGIAYLLMEAFKPEKWLLMQFFKYLCLASAPFLFFMEITKPEDLFYHRLDRIKILQDSQMYIGNMLIGLLFCILIALTITHLIAPFIIDRRERKYEQGEAR